MNGCRKIMRFVSNKLTRKGALILETTKFLILQQKFAWWIILSLNEVSTSISVSESESVNSGANMARATFGIPLRAIFRGIT